MCAAGEEPAGRRRWLRGGLLVGGCLLAPPGAARSRRLCSSPSAPHWRSGGISHSPLEHVAADDVAAATATLYRYLRAQLLPEEGQAAGQHEEL